MPWWVGGPEVLRFDGRLVLGSEKKPWGLYILLCLDIALAVLVRPTNIIILLWFGFLDTASLERILQESVFSSILCGFFSCSSIQFMVLVPQFMYWKYLTGIMFFILTPGEIFFWSHPQMIKEWILSAERAFPVPSGLHLLCHRDVHHDKEKKEQRHIHAGLLPFDLLCDLFLALLVLRREFRGPALHRVHPVHGTAIWLFPYVPDGDQEPLFAFLHGPRAYALIYFNLMQAYSALVL